jgi:hypothetical protein
LVGLALLCRASLLAASWTEKAGAAEVGLLLQGTVVTMDDARSVIAPRPCPRPQARIAA